MPPIECQVVVQAHTQNLCHSIKPGIIQLGNHTFANAVGLKPFIALKLPDRRGGCGAEVVIDRQRVAKVAKPRLQALDRAGLPGSREDKGAEAVAAALATVAAIRSLDAPPTPAR